MFDYPIPQIRGGLYARLGLSPEATAEEINEARQALSFRLRANLKKIQRELDQVYRAVPGLRETLDRVESLLIAANHENPGELRELQTRLGPLEDQARTVNPEFRSLRERAAQMEREINEANVLAIQNPEDRREYDQSHPPFEILKLEDCSSNPLDDRRAMLVALRAELTEFLEQAGEQVSHPSDRTRTDFTHDFTLDRTLDR